MSSSGFGPEKKACRSVNHGDASLSVGFLTVRAPDQQIKTHVSTSQGGFDPAPAALTLARRRTPSVRRACKAPDLLTGLVDRIRVDGRCLPQWGIPINTVTAVLSDASFNFPSTDPGKQRNLPASIRWAGALPDRQCRLRRKIARYQQSNRISTDYASSA
jgi:hypothetical protein